MKYYVCGFLFNAELDSLVLIKKNRPEWQAGLLNGVGGKIEYNETIEDCMRRKFLEETGVDTGRKFWVDVCVLQFDYAQINFFAAANTDFFEKVTSTTDEEVIKVKFSELGKYTLIKNIPALITLSLLRLIDKECRPFVPCIKETVTLGLGIKINYY